MILRMIAPLAALTITASAGYSETINLRNSCEPWEHIPKNETWGTPASALLQCSDDQGVWLAVQIMCFTETAEMEFRYRPRYEIAAPVKPEPVIEPPVEVVTLANGNTINLADLTLPKTKEIEPKEPTLAENEMLFFDLPKIGVSSVATYDYDAKDWSYRDKEPLGPLFWHLVGANFVKISLVTTGVTEQLPLKGSSKAIRPILEACRIAKRKLEAAPKVFVD